MADVLRPQAGHSDSAAQFDLDHDGATHEPFPGLEALRRGGEVQFLPRHGHWIVLGYDAVREALARPADFSSSPQAAVDPVLLGADPPGHTAARRLLARRFTAAAVTELASCARRDAAGLIRPSFDLVGDFAVPLARAAAARLVGLDVDELAAILTAPDISQPPQAMTIGSRALLSRARLFGELLSEGDGALDETAAASLVRLLCLAATVTTERLIIRTGAAYLCDDALREQVDRSPVVQAAFIEEVARLLPPEPNVVRRTTGPTVLADVAIPGGAEVFLSLLAANRDARRFMQPQQLRLDRGRNEHLAFSDGPHKCIGARLGRSLAAVGLSCLAERSVRSAAPAAVADLAVVQGIATPRRLMVTAP